MAPSAPRFGEFSSVDETSMNHSCQDVSDELFEEFTREINPFRSNVIYIGGSLASSNLCHSRDSRKVVVAGRQRVREININTGLACREIDAFEILAPNEYLVSVTLDEFNPDTVYTISSENIIDFWCLNSGKPLKSLKFKMNVSHILPDAKESLGIYVVICSLPSGQFTQEREQFSWIYFLPPTHDRATKIFEVASKITCAKLSKSGNILAFVCGRTAYCVSTQYSSKFSVLNVDSNITCIDVSPKSSIIAIGDEFGKIYLWHHNFMGRGPISKSEQETEVLHWHSQRVNALAFSLDGLSLISGGLEMVLVFWSMETRLKRFIPRLQSHILSIVPSPDGTSLSVLFADNSIRNIEIGSMLQKNQIIGPKEIVTNSASGKHTFKNDLDNVLLVLQNRSGALQFFDFVMDNVSFEVDVTKEVLKSQPNTNDSIGGKIECLSIHKDGTWMLTLDSCDSEINEKGEDNVIKYWKRSKDKSSFSLSARIYSTHKGAIKSMVISPSKEPMFAVASLDCVFRIWKLENDKWTSTEICHYENDRSLALSFSKDGAVLAVASSKMITLWDPLLCSIHATLPFQGSSNSTRDVSFYMDSYLISRMSNKLCIWDLKTLTVVLCLHLHIKDVIESSDSKNFAVLTKSKNQNQDNILVFEELNVTPIFEIIPREGYVSSKFIHYSTSTAIAILYNDSSIEIHSMDGQQPLQQPLIRNNEPEPDKLAGIINHVSIEDVNKKVDEIQEKGVKPEFLFCEKYSKISSHMIGRVENICSEYLDMCLLKHIQFLDSRYLNLQRCEKSHLNHATRNTD